MVKYQRKGGEILEEIPKISAKSMFGGKKMKKLVSLFLVFVLMLSTIAVNADSKIEINESIKFYTRALDVKSEQYLCKVMPDILNKIVKFDSYIRESGMLVISKPIPVFEVVNEELIENGVLYLPVIKGKSIIAFIALYKDNDENISITLLDDSSYYFEKIKKSNDTYLLIAYDGQLIAATSDELVLLNNNSTELNTEVKSIISSVIGSQKLNLSNVDLYNDTQPWYNQSLIDISSYPSQAYIDIPLIGQGNRPICWAAVTAAILNYKYGTTLNAEMVANKVGSDTGSFENMEKAYTLFNFTPTFIDSPLIWEDVLDRVLSKDPVQMLLIYGTDRGHVVALSGYSASPSGSSIRVMDPSIPSNDWMYTSSGNWYFIHNGVPFRWYYTYSISK